MHLIDASALIKSSQFNPIKFKDKLDVIYVGKLISDTFNVVTENKTYNFSITYTMDNFTSGLWVKVDEELVYNKLFESSKIEPIKFTNIHNDIKYTGQVIGDIFNVVWLCDKSLDTRISQKQYPVSDAMMCFINGNWKLITPSVDSVIKKLLAHEEIYIIHGLDEVQVYMIDHKVLLVWYNEHTEHCEYKFFGLDIFIEDNAGLNFDFTF